MRKVRTRRGKRHNKKTRKHSGGDERSNIHNDLMSTISEQDYATSLALIKQKLLQLVEESESIFSTNHKKLIIEKEINDLYQLGMRIREKETGIQSLKKRKKNIEDISYDTNLNLSQKNELKHIQNMINKINKENEQRQQSYNTTITLYEARKKQAQFKKGNEWNSIQTRARR